MASDIERARARRAMKASTKVTEKLLAELRAWPHPCPNCGAGLRDHSDVELIACSIATTKPKQGA